MTANNRNIEIGTAAEMIVCADLILCGHRAFLSSQGLPYDVVLDIGTRLLRVTVKGTLAAAVRPAREASRVCYQFAALRSKRLKTGRSVTWAYTSNDADVFAFVALDRRIVGYVPIKDRLITSWHVDPPGTTKSPLDRLGRRNSQNRKHFEDFTLAHALRALGVGT